MVKSADRQQRNTGHYVSRCLAVMLSCGISLASVAQNERNELPDIGLSAGSVLSPQQEKAYAESLIRQMRAYEVLVDDPQITAFFSDMGFRLVSNSDRPDKNFTFVVLKEPVVNAFAAPGGVIALNSGLILAADTESEVAGVLSHEIAHVTQAHLIRAFENAQRMSIPLALAMLGLILAGGGDGDVVQGAILGGLGLAQQNQINFTRQNEYEADRIGIQTLSASGYDPLGMAAFFAKLGRITRANGEGPPEFLRTHPVTVNRIAEAQNRAQNMPPAPPRDSGEFFLMQARLRALLEPFPQTALEWFQYRFNLPGISQDELIAQKYGIAISLQRKGDYDRAREILNELQRNDPIQLTYPLQLAALEMDEGNHEQAYQRLSQLYHNFPGNHAIAVQYSQALLSDRTAENAEMASTILRQELLGHKDNPSLHELYAQASNIAGNSVRASEAIAESYYQRGRLHEAVIQLEKLVKQPDLDYYQRSRVSARLTELQIQLGDFLRERRRG